MRKTHDAELCERIRELEERVRELEARPHTTYVHWCYSGCPLHYPTITWGTNTTGWQPPADTTITYSIGDI